MKSKIIYLVCASAILLGAAWTAVRSPAPAAADAKAEEETAKKALWSAQSELARYKDGLPAIKIRMDRGAEPFLRVRRWAELEILSSDRDASPQKAAAQLWIRGQSSATYPKKQYGVDFFEDRDGTKKKELPVLGMAEGSDWVLNGPYYDRSLMRNVLMYSLARDLTEWAPDTRFCEVWLEDEYQGVYVMIEDIKVSPRRLNLYDQAFSTGETAYMLLRDRAGKDKNALYSYAGETGETTGALYVEYPTRNRLTREQSAWIENDISEFERLLYLDTEENRYLDQIDIQSFADYYILNEFSMNRDAGSYSTYCYRDMKGKLCMGPVWDFNNSFNLYVEELSEESFIVSSNNWFLELLEDKEFADEVVKRYRELRKGILSEESLFERIDTYALVLGDAPRRNLERWPPARAGEARRGTTFAEALAILKDSIHRRGVWMDENIEQLYLYSE